MAFSVVIHVRTIIKYSIPATARVTLGIYNMLGEKIKTLLDDTVAAGEHSINWNGTNDSGKRVSSGIYLIRLSSGENNQMRKMVLLK